MVNSAWLSKHSTIINYLLLILLVLLFPYRIHCNGFTPGNYAGEFYTNNIWWIDTNSGEQIFGIAYSPDFGRTLEIVQTSNDAGLCGSLHGTDYSGIFYLHTAMNESVNFLEKILTGGIHIASFGCKSSRLMVSHLVMESMNYTCSTIILIAIVCCMKAMKADSIIHR